MGRTVRRISMQTLQLEERWWEHENKSQQLHRPISFAEEIQEIHKVLIKAKDNKNYLREVLKIRFFNFTKSIFFPCKLKSDFFLVKHP